MDFSFAPLTPLGGEFASSCAFADPLEQFGSMNDPFFNFEQADFLPLEDLECIDPALFTSQYPDPLMGLQTPTYLYPQSLPDERDYEPHGLLSSDAAFSNTLPLASQLGTASPMVPTPIMGSEPRLAKPKKSKVAKPSKEKAEKSDDSSIDMPIPLSRLFPQIPLMDAEAYIRRPKELREAEWRRRRDFPKMPRPVNAFLLYRRAITEKAKYFAGGVENHQVISKIAGVSWRNESDEVRNAFNGYAELEKVYHETAFPGYKFAPNRPEPKGKGKGNDSDDTDDDELYAMPNSRQYQAYMSPKQGQKNTEKTSKESIQPVSPPTKSTARPRTILKATGSVKSVKGSVKSPVRQLSKRLRPSQRKVNYAEDSDSEDDEPVRTTKRRRSQRMGDTIEVKC